MEKTQLEIASEQLENMVPDITASDRLEAEGMYSRPTIIKYLAGKGTDLDVAMELLQFFRKKIESRDQILKAG